jgi:hypothetical protein
MVPDPQCRMSESSSEFFHESISRALKAGDFDTVRQLSSKLGQAIIREANNAPEPERRALVDRSLNRLREHLSLARVLRAHISSQLQKNKAASLYQESPSGSHRWRFDG